MHPEFEFYVELNNLKHEENVMIKSQGKFRKVDGTLFKHELDASLSKLPDGESFRFLIVDDKPNRVLPQLTYLFSVLLKVISDQLPDHPPTEALYRYFEEEFAPLHTCKINGEVYEYTDLKRERVVDVGKFVESVTEFARKEWHLEIPENKDLKKPENAELYSQAYLQQEVDWCRFLSSKNKK